MPTSVRLGLVQRVAERLADSRDACEVAGVVAAALEEALGASLVAFGVLSADGRELVTPLAEGQSGHAPGQNAEPVTLDPSSPATEVLERGDPVYWSSLEQGDPQQPPLLGYGGAHRSWAMLPLVVRGTSIGLLALGWEEPQPFRRSETALLEVIAHQCALAVERSRLEEASRAERKTLELLSEGTRLMVSALDPDRVVTNLVRLAVPELAPWCAVYVAEGKVLRRVAIEIDRDEDLADQLRGTVSVGTDDDVPLALAYRSGQAQVVPRVSEELVRRIYRGPQATRILALQEQWTSLAVPVRSGGHNIGVMSLVSNTWRGSPPAEVLFAAEGLAGRAGVALTNARRFEQERDTAALLTRALLPPDAPAVPGYDIAARYLPAGSRVAGDWFDVARLPSGSFLVGVGDAGGHGLPAASLMAQLRNGARGLAFGGHSPGEILHFLTLLTAEGSADWFATALYGLLDPGAGSVLWASCGHLVPLLSVRGETRWLEQRVHPPLGWPMDEAPPEHELNLEAGETLVLVTDGVVERRGALLTAGMAELSQLVSQCADLPAAAIGQRIIEAMCREPEDDCCLVVLKRNQ